MRIHKEISILLKEGVISSETAKKIENYYLSKKNESKNRLPTIFSVLGAVLIGLGIILIIAHNWDALSRFLKTIFAFCPILIGQILCGYSLLKKNNSIAWKESSSAFLFLSIGSCISLISQIYHLPTDISSFVLYWMLLGLPLLYVMNSSITSIFYILGITYYVSEMGYWSYPSESSMLYWLLLLAALPHYYVLLKYRPKSNFVTFHNWLIPLSVLIALGTVSKHAEDLMFVAYMAMLGFFYFIGKLPYFKEQKLGSNAYIILGSLGMVSILTALSFNDFWEHLRHQNLYFSEILTLPEFVVSMITLTLSSTLFIYHRMKRIDKRYFDLFEYVYAFFFVIFFIGMHSSIAPVLINVLLFLLGVTTIIQGAKKDHLGLLNYGLLIMSVLLISRFFDVDLSFVVRGILFVLVGIGFLVSNFLFLRKRNQNG